jgi:lysozyme
MIDDLKKDLLADEGLKLRPYLCTAGKSTIGVGRNLDDVGITKEEAMLLLDNDIDRSIAQMDHAFPWAKIKPNNVRRGLANMIFQMGISRVSKFNRMLSCLEAGDYKGAKREGLDSTWAKQTPARANRVTDLFIKET